jgi:small basic protein (TIGR04137 family)
MSIHRSLKSRGNLIRKRNVWTRVERIETLRREGRWEEGDPVTGLPKVRTHFKTKTKKKLKESAAAEKAKASEETPQGEA